MSVAGILDAMRSDLPPAHRLVWACLENHANGARFWAISAREIAAEISLHTETVCKAITDLEARQIIRVERRQWTASVYHMLRSYCPEKPDSACPEKPDSGPVACPEEPDTPCPEKPDVENPPVESTSNPPTPRKRGEVIDHPRFEEFWLAYPRRIAKRYAAKCYLAAINRGADPDVMLEALRRQRFSDDPKYQPHPSSWLNGSRWLDDDKPPLTVRERARANGEHIMSMPGMP